MNIEKIEISQLRLKDDNPRFIRDKKFRELVKSIKDFPQMMEIRPIVIDDTMEVLGGNQRLKAVMQLGWKDVWVVKASELNEKQKREFVIKDNVSFGEWHVGKLADEWADVPLEEWGLKTEDLQEKETKKESKDEQACSLMIHFDNEEDRESFVNGGGIEIKKKIGKIWRGHYLNNDITLF
jgi:ParB-like chromosome segregation protein Spo0J